MGDGDPVDSGSAQNVSEVVIEALGDYLVLAFIQADGTYARLYLTRVNPGTPRVQNWDTTTGWAAIGNADPIDVATGGNADIMDCAAGTNSLYILFTQIQGGATRLYMSRYYQSGNTVWVRNWDEGTNSWSGTLNNGDPIDNGRNLNVAGATLCASSAYYLFRQPLANGGSNRLFLGRYYSPPVEGEDDEDDDLWDGCLALASGGGMALVALLALSLLLVGALAVRLGLKR
jgi:hypothetical protein